MKIILAYLILLTLFSMLAYVLFNSDKQTERDLETEDTQWHG
jgi:hypothetical protein